MTDLLPTLAERLRDIPAIHSSECAILDEKACDCVTFPAYELLAREALAFVAERLPTRDLMAHILGNSQMLRENEWQQADALLRERLGVQR